MATQPSMDDKARTVLDIFKAHNARPGHVLLPNSFFAYAAKTQTPNSDLADGMKHGESLGWFKEAQNGLELTDAGFAAM